MESFSDEDVQKGRRLVKRCDVLEEDHERLMGRIHGSKNLMLRCKSDIGLLTAKLVAHQNSLRAIPVDVPVSVTKQSPVIKPQASAKQPDKQNAGGSKQATKRKSKADMPENDPNAPKKQPKSCPEQNLHVFAETNSEIGIEPSKKEVMQLAQRCHHDAKCHAFHHGGILAKCMWQVFMRSKERYTVQMAQYKTLKKGKKPQQQ